MVKINTLTGTSAQGSSSHFDDLEMSLRGRIMRGVINPNINYRIDRGGLSSPPTPPPPAPTIVTYLWGAEEDKDSTSINQAFQTQTSKLQKAIDFYKEKEKALNDWFYNSGVVRNMTDADVLKNRSDYDLAQKSEKFYEDEETFTLRVAEAISNTNLSPDLSTKFIQLYDQLDNLRDNYDRNMQLGFNGDAFGSDGFIAKLQLDKAKFLIEDVILKGGTMEDFNRFSKTFDDQIAAAQNSMTAKAAGKPEEAAMWDFMSGKIKDLRTDYLNSLLGASTSPNPDSAKNTASAQFFDNNYAALTGRIENSMLTAINNGSRFTDLINVKADPQDVMTIREEFDSVMGNLLDYAQNNKSIEQIMAEKATKVLDYDRDHDISDKEVAGAVMDAMKAEFDFQNSHLYNANFDLNNDGAIDATDLTYLEQTASEHNHLFTLINKAITVVDSNSDGAVSIDEARTAFTSFQDAYAHKANPSADQLKMDLDSNGAINMGDFDLILDVLMRRSRLGANISNLDSASTGIVDTLLKSISNNETNLVDAVDSMNTALDEFDAAAGNLAARTQYDTDFRYARWADVVANNRQATDASYARVLVTAPNRLNGRETVYAQRTAALDTAYNALHESIMGEKDYWRDTRLKELEYSQQTTAVSLLVRGASDSDLARMDKLYDFFEEIDTDRTNYRYGYNIDLSTYVPGGSTGDNPDHIKNTALADFSAQSFTQIARLIQTQNTNINKLDPAKTDIFNQGLNTLMNLYNQAKQVLVVQVKGMVVGDTSATALKAQFDAYQAALTTLLSTGVWQAPPVQRPPGLPPIY